MKLISPDGNVTIDAHPSKIESLKNQGWKEEAAPKEIKSSSKNESKDEVENGKS
tara:strand:- start:2132 stop:2293 length:162 start_codon:yes stop_codon:yes gene_type:complete